MVPRTRALTASRKSAGQVEYGIKSMDVETAFKREA